MYLTRSKEGRALVEQIDREIETQQTCLRVAQLSDRYMGEFVIPDLRTAFQEGKDSVTL